jgi:hypothetical protein
MYSINAFLSIENRLNWGPLNLFLIKHKELDMNYENFINLCHLVKKLLDFKKLARDYTGDTQSIYYKVIKKFKKFFISIIKTLFYL